MLVRIIQNILCYRNHHFTEHLNSNHLFFFIKVTKCKTFMLNSINFLTRKTVFFVYSLISTFWFMILILWEAVTVFRSFYFSWFPRFKGISNSNNFVKNTNSVSYLRFTDKLVWFINKTVIIIKKWKISNSKI